MKGLNKSLKNGLKYSIILSILVIIGVLVFTTEEKTLNALLKLDILTIFYAILLNILSWIFSALRYMSLINSVEKKINFIEALQIHLSYYFAAGITPTSAGGEPLEIYLLSKKNIKVGQVTALSLLRYTLNVLIFAIATPIVLYFYSFLFPNRIVKDLIRYSSFFLGFVVGIFLISLYKPKPVKKILAKFLLRICHFPFLRNIHPYKLIRAVYKTVDDFHKTLWTFMKDKKLNLLKFSILNILSWFTYFLIAPIILKGFGLRIYFLNLILIQIPIFFLLFYVPTPGGSGASELLFSLAFAPYVPKYILGIFIIIWRLLTHYFTLIIGGFVLVYILGIKNWGNNN
ncbi:MAG: flippase-like domain-containing protein [Dictyoglomus sp.]|nr:flippase-like domain-containing protein [Dictyoglomus sp.]MCX7942712.1 flippase-like domain-containing protein [Dictyoglomaceae bacterium]MDW8189274.1 lysylphosphatidylglycerol synthase transmembrane domain-containing protein [Dictyoglomus sp.]